jgi:methylase of polypeptide subunit release factors
VEAVEGMAQALFATWNEDGAARTARWRAESGQPPKRIELVGDVTRADAAFRQACEGTSLLYRGDWRNARQLLAALTRRLEERAGKRPAEKGELDLRGAFLAHRQHQSTVHQVTSRLLVGLDGQWRVEAKQAPDLRQACQEVWGRAEGPSLTPLRGLLGMVGAHEWRAKGVEVAAIGGRVHPHYGVFAPVRGEYVDLVAAAPLGKVGRAFDVGVGTGVLSVLLAHRGVPEVVATDLDPRAVACARENVERFGFSQQVRVEERDLFPEGLADLVVFNPPWIPARPRTPVERAIFDPDSELLLRFLRELPEHLSPGGEAWLVISNLAELLGLRPRGLVVQAAGAANLAIRGQSSTPARHKKSQDADDPLYPARSREVTTLYRIGHRGEL